MTADPFNRDHHPPIGAVERPAPGLRVVTAPNAGPMTFTGTRSYIVGEALVAVIDPGPMDAAHLAALHAAVAGEAVAAVLVTHAHRDHSAGAAAFARAVGAPVLAMGLAPREDTFGGGEGRDEGFVPDRRIGEGEVIAGPGWSLTALRTPGHTMDHLSFAWAEGRALFSGDIVMGWATTLISPPDGHLGAFRASLTRLRARGEEVYYPGHGAPVHDPAVMIDWQLHHRAEREAQILARLADGPSDIPDLVARLYVGLDPALRPAAARNVLAHLIDLVERGRVAAPGGPSPAATYRRL